MSSILVCIICGYKVTAKGALHAHIEIKHKGKMFQCISFNKEYKSGPALGYHTLSVHQDIKYKCDFCEYSSPQKSDLTRHIKSVHIQGKTDNFHAQHVTINQLGRLIYQGMI